MPYLYTTCQYQRNGVVHTFNKTMSVCSHIWLKGSARAPKVGHVFRSCNSNLSYLLPMSLKHTLPQTHAMHCVSVSLGTQCSDSYPYTAPV